MTAIIETHLNLPGQTKFYKGKVRDVYTLENNLLVMVACDRISAFDVVLPNPIPYKGQVLNQLAKHFLELSSNIVPNWLIACPDPNVSIGYCCNPFPIEMVIRGYLSGHAWREYQSGKRVICGVPMPDGLKENDAFPVPIITPTIKASVGHDEDISREEIIAQGIVSEKEYLKLEEYTRALFKFGSEYALEQGLILVDTKYEFGERAGKIMLMDEIHTPDSSRYFYADTYQQIQEKDQQQRQLSKEFVRKWLIENGFQGKENQTVPVMDDYFVNSVTERYIELFEKVSGTTFQKQNYSDAETRIEKNILSALEKINSPS
jgi:phosphoribosylaminoimidazole-succinocarboxamide synthase